MTKDSEKPAAAPDEEIGIRSETYEWVEAVVFSVAVLVVIFSFVFRIVGVEGPSMQRTLQNGNRVIISDLNYHPKRGDIIVLSTKAVVQPIIKRVIAVGGQTVRIDYDSDSVYVDGKKISEPYLWEAMHRMGDVSGTITVPEGDVFVMGDNRNDSYDSRFNAVGMIDQRYILGKAIFRIFPFSELGFLH